MNVLNRLTAVFADICDDSVAVCKSAFLCDSGDGLEDFCNNCGIGFVYLVCRLNVLLGNNDYVYGSLRCDVAEGKNLLVLINLVGGDVSLYDFTENTIHINISLSYCAGNILPMDNFNSGHRKSQ